MPVIIRLRFPGGQYHATPWGRHVNEGVPEWPPSPWRFLRAIVAVWKRTCSEFPDTQVKRILLLLSQPPRFQLPRHRVAHTRHYMPLNKKSPLEGGGGTTLVFDTFVSVSRTESVFMGWPEAELSPEDRAALAIILKNMASLGRAEGWIEASLHNAHVELPLGPAADNDSNPVPVFCPDPETAFADEYYPQHDPKKLARGKINPADYFFNCPRWHLCLDTQTIHENRWPTVPGARWVNYTRPAERGSTAPPKIARVRSSPTVARFLLDGPVLPLVTDTVRVAEGFRNAGMSLFKRWCHRQLTPDTDKYRRNTRDNQFSSPILSGKDADGQLLNSHAHAFYLPTPESEDRRRVTHLTVYSRQGFGPGEIEALTGIRQILVGELALQVQLIALGQPSEFRTQLFGGSAGNSREWVSVTPVIGPSHIGKIGRERHLMKSVRRELRRWVEEYSPGVQVELAELIDNSHALLVGRPRPIEFARSRNRPGDDGYQRPFSLIRVRFSAPVAGPLAIGYACHFGLGLFLPVGE